MIHPRPQRLGKINLASASTLFLFLGIMLCPSGCPAHGAAPKLRYKLFHRISYVHPADQIRDGQLYLPDSPGAHPAVLLIHGGEWTCGSNHNTGVSFLAPRLAARGWVVFNINYRLVRQGGAFPADVQDVKNALAWMILHAKKYHINARDIIPVGLSAGAHLALMAAYTIRAHRFPATQYRDVKLHVKAAVGFYTPTDLSFINLLINLLPKKSWAYRAIFQYVEPYVEPWLKKHPHHGLPTASPVFYAADGVPTLLLQGSMDYIVPAFQATEMAAALKKNAVPEQVVMIPNIGHAFMSFPDKARAVGFSALLKFLDQQTAPGRTPASTVAAVH